MTSNRLKRVVISTASLTRSLAFYADLLELPLVGRHDEMATLDLGGTQLLLHQRSPQPTDTGVAPCLTVIDLESTIAAWSAAGGVIIDRPCPQPWGEVMSVVRDPDGHLVCLVQAT